MDPERVAHAAIRLRRRVFTSRTHKMAARVAAIEFSLDPKRVWREIRPQDQGFVSTLGRWLSRTEAWRLAKRRGQIRPDHLERDGQELFSEDLQ